MLHAVVDQFIIVVCKISLQWIVSLRTLAWPVYFGSWFSECGVCIWRTCGIHVLRQQPEVHIQPSQGHDSGILSVSLLKMQNISNEKCILVLLVNHIWYLVTRHFVIHYDRLLPYNKLCLFKWIRLFSTRIATLGGINVVGVLRVWG